MARGALLANCLESQAGWRSDMAEQFPEDGRNAHSSLGLDSAADYARPLPDEGPRLARMQAAGVFLLPGVPLFGERAREVVRGWDYSLGGYGLPDDLVDWLTEAAEADWSADA